MKRIDAVKMTREELDKYGLTEVRVVINNRLTRAFGRYRYHLLKDDRWIELSGKLVDINSEERVRRTILHEVAHALTEGHHHDNVWKAKCKEIGGDGIPRYSTADTNMPAPRARSSKLYHLECQECDYTCGRYRRRMNGYIHRGCGGKMVSIEIGW